MNIVSESSILQSNIVRQCLIRPESHGIGKVSHRQVLAPALVNELCVRASMGSFPQVFRGLTLMSGGEGTLEECHWPQVLARTLRVFFCSSHGKYDSNMVSFSCAR